MDDMAVRLTEFSAENSTFGNGNGFLVAKCTHKALNPKI